MDLTPSRLVVTLVTIAALGAVVFALLLPHLSPPRPEIREPGIVVESPTSTPSPSVQAAITAPAAETSTTPAPEASTTAQAPEATAPATTAPTTQPTPAGAGASNGNATQPTAASSPRRTTAQAVKPRPPVAWDNDDDDRDDDGDDDRDDPEEPGED